MFINYVWLSSVLLLLFTTLIRYSNANRRLEDLNLSTIPYDKIHKLAILDQIDNYIPPIKSLNTRQTQSLDGIYDFCLDPQARGLHEAWFNGDLFDKCQSSNFYRMPVPSAFNDIVPNTTVKNYMGWFWYQTEIAPQLTVSSGSSNFQWYLQLDSINYLAIVWLKTKTYEKAKFVGSHVGGHLPLVLNISHIANNVNPLRSFRLTIAVSNMLTHDTIPSGNMLDLSHLVGHDYKQFRPDFDFFHFAGVMGSVHLIKLPRRFITKVEVMREQSEDNSFIILNLCLSSPIDTDNPIGIETSINRRHISLEWSFVLGQSNNCNTTKCVSSDCLQTFLPKQSLIDNLKPRSVGTDGFYRPTTIRIEISSSDQRTNNLNNYNLNDFYELNVFPFDNLDTNNISYSKYRQLQGFGMHHEQLFSGRTMSLAAIMKDIYLLKQMGANVIRTSHYPYSEAYLDACDNNGIMVIAECPAVGLNSFSDTKLMLHKQILLEMMQRDHHHPSIIMWSIANEPQSQLDKARAYFKSLLDYARNNLSEYTVKMARPLTAAIAQSHLDDKIGDLLDIIMVNRYYGWYDYTGALETIRPALMASLAGWSQKHPGKPLILSEFGADAISGLHKSTRQVFSEEYQRDLLAEHERVFDELAATKNSSGINFLGSMIWNFADFSTHDSLMRAGGNRKGIFTQTREPKLAAESVQSFYKARRQA